MLRGLVLGPMFWRPCHISSCLHHYLLRPLGECTIFFTRRNPMRTWTGLSDWTEPGTNYRPHVRPYHG